MNVLLFLAAAAVIYLLWLPTVKRGVNKLSCQRRFSKGTFNAGDEGELIEVIRNDSPFIIPWLRLESRISPHIRLGKYDNLDVSGQMHYSSLFAPMPYQQIRRTHKVRFHRRGVYNLGNASLTAGDPLGLTRIHREQNLSAGVTVYPQLLEDEQLPVPLSRLLGTLTNRKTLLEDPFLVRGIRAYQPGDPVRDIHWPATARTGQAQLRIRDHTDSVRLLVVLNGQYESLQWQEHLPERMEPLLEHGISLAATLCVQALQNGLCAGFATNLSMQGSREPTILLPSDGTTQEESLLSAMAQLDTAYRQKFPALLEDLSRCTELDILVLSCYNNALLQDRMAQLRQRGNHVTFHLLEGGGV